MCYFWWDLCYQRLISGPNVIPVRPWEVGQGKSLMNVPRNYLSESKGLRQRLIQQAVWMQMLCMECQCYEYAREAIIKVIIIHPLEEARSVGCRWRVSLNPISPSVQGQIEKRREMRAMDDRGRVSLNPISPSVHNKIRKTP